MDGVSIIGVALGVGVVVYVLSLRSPDEPLEANRLPPAAGATRSWLGPEPEPESSLYVPVLRSAKPLWRTRIHALAGLLLAVTAAGLAVAVGVYQFGHVLSQMIEGYLSSFNASATHDSREPALARRDPVGQPAT